MVGRSYILDFFKNLVLRGFSSCSVSVRTPTGDSWCLFLLFLQWTFLPSQVSAYVSRVKTPREDSRSVVLCVKVKEECVWGNPIQESR